MIKDFEAVELSLVNLLAPLRRHELLARALPDAPGEYGQMVGNGVITLALETIAPAANASLDAKAQARKYSIVLDARLKSLRGPSGVYQITAELEQLLTGQRVQGLGLLVFAGWQLLERTESYWRFEARWKVERLDRVV